MWSLSYGIENWIIKFSSKYLSNGFAAIELKGPFM